MRMPIDESLPRPRSPWMGSRHGADDCLLHLADEAAAR